METFTASSWSWLLCYQPQFAEGCDKWDQFSSEAWARILSLQPQFADKCDFRKFTNDNWSFLLSYQPQLADKCKKSTVLVYLLMWHPQLIEYCNTSFITEKGKAKILAKHPDLAKYFNDKNGK